MANGEKVQGQLARLDNFFVTLLLDDGRLRTIRRDGDLPKVEVKDPLEFHKNAAGDPDRQGHARRNRLSGDTQMTFKKLLVTASLAGSPVLLLAQGRGLDPAKLLKPLADEWPTYSGDYSGKRYSLLTQINQADREEPDARVDAAAHRRPR